MEKEVSRTNALSSVTCNKELKKVDGEDIYFVKQQFIGNIASIIFEMWGWEEMCEAKYKQLRGVSRRNGKRK